MKLKTLKYFVATLAVCLSCAATCEGCEDDEQYQKERERVWTALPEATQKGANTIGCYIDGRLWATGDIGYIRTFKFSFKAMSAEYFSSRYPTKLGIWAAASDARSVLLTVMSPKEGSISKIHKTGGTVYPFSLSATEVGEIFITKLDTVQKIVSGHFSADIEVLPGDTVRVTDGRFDMKLEIL